MIDHELIDPIRAYVRAYVWWYGHKRVSEDFGVSRHTLWRFLERGRILTEETIVELVTLVAEETDAMAGELAGRMEVIEVELLDVRRRLERLYEALETSDLTLEVLSPRIFSLRHREEQLEAAREDAAGQLEQGRVELPTTEEIKGYVADFREFLQEGTIPERKALIRNFVEGIEVIIACKQGLLKVNSDPRIIYVAA